MELHVMSNIHPWPIK